MENLKVKDIMTKVLATVEPEDSVVYAAEVLAKHNFNGLPVISKEGVLIGIITEYDLISQSNAVRLPTLINILGNMSFYKKDKSMIKDDLRNLLSLKVRDIMNTDPLTVEDVAWIQEAADLFAHHHRVNPIPVVDQSKKLVGIVSRFDLVKLLANSRAGQNDVDTFIDDFERRFSFGPKKNYNFWPVAALIFSIICFAITTIIIVKIALG